MKPDFALSLSADGIILYERAQSGWYNLGTVPFSSSDLSSALDNLRAKGANSDTEIQCKLIIPDDQIRFLTIETGTANSETRFIQARAALEGATPYSVDELALDISEDGAFTHIAAVALETLAEAEAFATEHKFTPVSFVASPSGQAFSGEPFFGTAQAALGIAVERDTQALVDLGSPTPAIAPATPDEPTPSADPDPIAETSPPLSETSAEANPDLEKDVEEEDVTEKDETQAEAASDLTRPEDAKPDSPPAQETDVEDVSATKEVPEEEATATSGFISRRAGSTPAAAPAPQSVDTHTPSKTNVALGAAPTATPTLAASSALGAAKRDFEPPKTAAAIPPAPVHDMPSVAAQIAAMREAAKAAAAPKPIEVPPVLQNKLRATAEQGKIPEFDATKFAAHNPLPPSEAGNTPKSTQISPRETALAATAEPTVGGKPRFLLVGLIGVLLLFMIAVATFALHSSDLELLKAEPEKSRLQPTTPPEPAPPSELSLPATLAPAATIAEPKAPDLSVEVLPTAPSETPSAPTSTLPSQQIASLGDISPDTPAVPIPAPLRTQPLQSEIVTPEQKDAPSDNSDNKAEVLTSSVTEAPAQIARYAATGIWQTSPKSPALPTQPKHEKIYVASLDRTNLASDAVSLPLAPLYETDRHPNAVEPAPAVGAEAATSDESFDLDDRGLVTATPEGTLNPDGVMVFLGRPSNVPPQRPAQAQPEQPAEAAIASVPAGKRPRARPTALQAEFERLEQERERIQQEQTRLAALAAKRPRARPARLQIAVQQALEEAVDQTPAPEAVEEEPVQVASIAPSARPRSRPANFNRLVNRARREAERTPTVAVPAAAAITPQQPSSASATRQATVRGAINLRKVNLIGVSGTASNRRAIVRLPSGRLKRVGVGDTIDGGRVVAIGTDQLRYQKRGRDLTLAMPNG
ncbi:hypothetical protein [Epibacterium ulvae]|uniref:hypothetical protein n=1 Tax=Epibacterium ulvae TaxID=1156985 RepID=UPI0024911AA6|nr:hypothetical protein [Epibacterium ulvae]